MQEKINISNELKDLNAAFLEHTDNKNLFTVPDNYFDNLAGNILSHVFIQSLPTVNPYLISAGYFEHFPEIVLDKLSVGSFNSKQKDLFAIPEGYFDNLASNILKKVKQPVSGSVQQELNELSPYLSKIPKENVYSIPANYFDELKPLTTSEHKEVKQETKIISMGSTTRKWLNYAVAACITAFAFTGGYFLLSKKSASGKNSVLATTDVQKQISVLSDDEITNYLKDNNNIAVYTNVGDDDQQQSMELQNLLQNVSDEEIQQYLNQDPESAETGGGI
ncbi:MAG: hypothetical protein ABJB05_11995 [Parafilimonas sp.]